MANPFTSGDTYEVELVDPIDGEKWTVEMRTLSAGDRAVLQDQLRIEMSDDEEVEVARLPMGTMRILTLDRAIVRWSLPIPKSRATIAALREDLFDVLFEHARFSDTSPAVTEDEDEPIESVLERPDPSQAEEGTEPPSPATNGEHGS